MKASNGGGLVGLVCFLVREHSPTKSVAGTGHESRSLTLEKKPEKGTALSRARAQ